MTASMPLRWLKTSMTKYPLHATTRFIYNVRIAPRQIYSPLSHARYSMSVPNLFTDNKVDLVSDSVHEEPAIPTETGGRQDSEVGIQRTACSQTVSMEEQGHDLSWFVQEPVKEQEAAVPAAVDVGQGITTQVLTQWIQASGGKQVCVYECKDASELSAMVVATASSTSHMRAVTDALKQNLKLHAATGVSVQGDMSEDWVVLDVGSVFVHIMTLAGREFYDLDGLWSNAGQDCVNDIEEDEFSDPLGPIRFTSSF